MERGATIDTYIIIHLTASTGTHTDACLSARGTVTANRTALCKRR